MRRIGSALAPVLLLAALLPWACGPRGDQRSGESTGVPQHAPEPAEPLGARVRPRDPLVRSMGPRLEEWEKRWSAVLPGFTLDSLFRGPTETFRYLSVRGATSEDRRRARFFGSVSPDSSRIVEPDSYRIASGPVPELWGEPDSAPAVLDLRRDSLYVLAVMGTLGGFEEAFWVDRDRAVVIGYGERRFDPWMGGGDLWVYDLRAGTLTRFHTPDVDQETFGRYLQLAMGELKRKFKVPQV